MEEGARGMKKGQVTFEYTPFTFLRRSVYVCVVSVLYISFSVGVSRGQRLTLRIIFDHTAFWRQLLSLNLKLTHCL